MQSSTHHQSAGFEALTGHPPTKDAVALTATPSDYPNLGSIVARLAPEQTSMPPFVALPQLIYLAIRNIMTLTSMVDGCLDSYSGTAQVSNFESHIIGCHVKGGGECTTSQRDFVDSNRTIYNVDQAVFTAQRVDAAATCADIRALLPVP